MKKQPSPPKLTSAPALDAAEDSSLFQTDEFRIWCFKVLPCSKRFVHDWVTCPFAHPGEKAKRRDPRVHVYASIACPETKQGRVCSRGDSCAFSHNIFEFWCHPSRYRTQLCNDGASCFRKSCFFAHTCEQLRVPELRGAGHFPDMNASACDPPHGQRWPQPKGPQRIGRELPAPMNMQPPAPLPYHHMDQIERLNANVLQQQQQQQQLLQAQALSAMQIPMLGRMPAARQQSQGSAAPLWAAAASRHAAPPRRHSAEDFFANLPCLDPAQVPPPPPLLPAHLQFAQGWCPDEALWGSSPVAVPGPGPPLAPLPLPPPPATTSDVQRMLALLQQQQAVLEQRQSQEQQIAHTQLMLQQIQRQLTGIGLHSGAAARAPNEPLPLDISSGLWGAGCSGPTSPMLSTAQPHDHPAPMPRGLVTV